MKKVKIFEYGRSRNYHIVICYTCNKEFPKRPGFIKKGVKNFCSVKCRDNYSFKIHITDDGYKICRLCNKKIPIVEFSKRKENIDGYDSRCKICSKKETKKRYHKNKSDPEFIKRKRISSLFSAIKTKYGLTKDDYNELLNKQNGVCVICKEVNNKEIKGTAVNLAVDHCHKTGKIRGLLCNNCNSGLGFFKDNIELLNEAISYLKVNGK